MKQYPVINPLASDGVILHAVPATDLEAIAECIAALERIGDFQPVLTAWEMRQEARAALAELKGTE